MGSWKIIEISLPRIFRIWFGGQSTDSGRCRGSRLTICRSDAIQLHHAEAVTTCRADSPTRQGLALLDVESRRHGAQCFVVRSTSEVLDVQQALAIVWAPVTRWAVISRNASRARSMSSRSTSLWSRTGWPPGRSDGS